MSLNDLKTITMKMEDTANFVVKLRMYEGVGFEVVWWRHNTNNLNTWDRKHGGITRDLAEAEARFVSKLREICIAEAKLALGLPPFDEKEK